MRLLLDTHTVIWFFTDNPRLPPHIREILESKSNIVYVSMISLWEMSIKSQRGKLVLHRSLADIVRWLRGNGFRLLTINLNHVYRLDTLESHHNDPFDRMLIAQSLAEDFVLVGCDEVFDRYGIRRLW
jgi:PIN domain nuclease of toxin-antitoxin system